jgi:hypothetical protein
MVKKGFGCNRICDKCLLFFTIPMVKMGKFIDFLKMKLYLKIQKINLRCYRTDLRRKAALIVQKLIAALTLAL